MLTLLPMLLLTHFFVMVNCLHRHPKEKRRSSATHHHHGRGGGHRAHTKRVAMEVLLGGGRCMSGRRPERRYSTYEISIY